MALRNAGGSAPRTRVARIAVALERFQGTPQQARRLPAPLDMLIATILSQNTSDKNSHRAYTCLREALPTWEAVALAPERRIRSLIRTGGMANQKAARIKEVLRTIHLEYGRYDLAPLRRRPDREIIARLTTMNGVGVKTAACVLLFSLRRDVFPVDTHVHRICNRLGLVRRCPTPEKTFWAMQPLIPAGKGYAFHTNLIRFGRSVCRSASPDCNRCPLYVECRWPGRRARRRTLRGRSRADHDFMLLDNVPV
jgi:endonuclease-3